MIERFLAMVFLPLCILLASQFALPIQKTTQVPTAAVANEISLVDDAPLSGAAATKVDVGLIFGNFLILCLYSFPMSFAENWAISDPGEDEKQPKTEMPEIIESTGKPSRTIGSESPTSLDQWKSPYERLSRWALKLPRVPAGLAAGGCLMIVVVVFGAVAFALYYLFSDQPENVSQIIPRFAYWFPFALLGMVTDVPFTFRIFDLGNRRKKVLLRLVVWWFPRVIIVAFMFNLPIMRDLVPATTALVVLAIDGVIAAFFMWLRSSRKQIRMEEV
ncbi:MAG TPA: hypothetical protein VFI27_22735 [candidate division Zixibacteria bacterium]|nr:hypothetical protein [candidate division Zixibacteria bacterium]